MKKWHSTVVKAVSFSPPFVNRHDPEHVPKQQCISLLCFRTRAQAISAVASSVPIRAILNLLASCFRKEAAREN